MKDKLAISPVEAITLRDGEILGINKELAQVFFDGERMHVTMNEYRIFLTIFAYYHNQKACPIEEIKRVADIISISSVRVSIAAIRKKMSKTVIINVGKHVYSFGTEIYFRVKEESMGRRRNGERHKIGW